jgi:diaminopimelate decarboxylase
MLWSVPYFQIINFTRTPIILMKQIKKILDNRSQLGDSSFYIYDESLIDKNISRFKSVPYPKTTIHFASMANDNPVLLSKLQQNGFGLFVNSRKHLQLGLECGFDLEKIIFASTGISKPTMQLIVDKGIHLNIDSQDQLELYGKLNPGGSIGIRLNIDEKSKNNIFSGMESRIGVLESELDQIFAIADKYQLKIIGTHVYLGTDVTSLEDMLEGVDKTLALSDHFGDLQYIDLGGGFPIEQDRFDFYLYKEEISQRLISYSEKRGRVLDLILEPGRSMFGNTAFFFAQVTDIKERPDRYLVCCNASASLLPRAMFYEDYNPVEPVNKNMADLYDKNVDIVGSTTYSRDFLAKKITLPRVKVADWLRFQHAGSYCYSMITRFLGQAIPPEFLLRTDGTVETIREGENFFGDVA